MSDRASHESDASDYRCGEVEAALPRCRECGAPEGEGHECRFILYRGWKIDRCEYGPGYVFEIVGDPESGGYARDLQSARETIDDAIVQIEDERERRAEAAMLAAGDGMC